MTTKVKDIVMDKAFTDAPAIQIFATADELDAVKGAITQYHYFLTRTPEMRQEFADVILLLEVCQRRFNLQSGPIQT